MMGAPLIGPPLPASTRPERMRSTGALGSIAKAPGATAVASVPMITWRRRDDTIGVPIIPRCPPDETPLLQRLAFGRAERRERRGRHRSRAERPAHRSGKPDHRRDRALAGSEGTDRARRGV